MGKRRQHARRNRDTERYQRMDQHSIGDRSGQPEQRGILGIADDNSGGAVADVARGVETDLGRDGRQPDHLPEFDHNLRDLDAAGQRVPSGTPPQVRRSFDPADIHQFISGVDASKLLGDERNVLLVWEGGIVLYSWISQGVYEITEFYHREFHGAYSVEASSQSLCWMYTHTDCAVVLMKTPCASIVARDPLIVETAGAVIQIKDDRTFKVLRAK